MKAIAGWDSIDKEGTRILTKESIRDIMKKNRPRIRR
jgi:hypothetical protein